jgi:hypothetical protein
MVELATGHGNAPSSCRTSQAENGERGHSRFSRPTHGHFAVCQTRSRLGNTVTRMKPLAARLVATLVVSGGLTCLVPGATAQAQINGDSVQCAVDNLCINQLYQDGGSTLVVGWTPSGQSYWSYNINWSPGETQTITAWDRQFVHDDGSVTYRIDGLYPDNTYKVEVQGCVGPFGCPGHDNSVYTMKGFAAPPAQGPVQGPVRQSPPGEDTRRQTVIPGVISPGLG